MEDLDEEELRMLAALEGEGEYDDDEWSGLDDDMGEIVDLGSDEIDEDQARARDAAEATGGRGASPFLPFDTEVKVAVIGRPNVGKSSILNRLLGEERHVMRGESRAREAAAPPAHPTQPVPSTNIAP